VGNPLLNPQVDSTLQQVFQLIVPEAVLVLTACLLFLYSTFKPARSAANLLALAGLFAASIALWLVPRPTDMLTTVGPLVGDSLGSFIRHLALLSGVVYVLISTQEAPDNHHCDYLACLLVAIAGVSVLGGANDLVTVFLALEMISIPTYVMLYLPRQDSLAQEAAIKYFMLSLLSSGLMLFGFSYLYGVTGVTNLTAILSIIPRMQASQIGILALPAAVLIIAGIGFRVTAVPFHFYAPDVYQGGPTSVAAFLSFVPKIAGFVLLLRLFSLAQDAFPYSNQISILLWSLAAITMTFGNVLALLQTNLKRMLAYSGVAHAGYMLMGMAVASNSAVQATAGIQVVQGNEAILFYLVAYGAMTVGLFAGIIFLSSTGQKMEVIDDLGGVGQSHPLMGGMMALFLFSLVGIPFTAGFIGKFLLFTSALNVPQAAPMHTLYQVLVVIAAINAAIAAYYYLRLIGVMYFRAPLTPAAPAPSGFPMMASILCAIATIAFGIYPQPLVNLSKSALSATATANAGTPVAVAK